VNARPKRRGQDIVNGATPAVLAVRQPTIFALAITLKTAKTLGLTIRQSILIRGDEGIG
jgi:hypothetical protein